MTGRTIHAGLELLDHQIVDRDGKLAGKVDDLELTLPQDGGPPFVSAILSGPGALSPRFGGRLGRWIEAAHRRLHPDQDPDPARVSFGVVKRIDEHVELSISRDGLETMRVEDWVRDHIIGKIPGAEHAAE
jgi:hypothetical protein